jgi:hypothetical protein
MSCSLRDEKRGLVTAGRRKGEEKHPAHERDKPTPDIGRAPGNFSSFPILLPARVMRAGSMLSTRMCEAATRQASRRQIISRRKRA